MAYQDWVSLINDSLPGSGAGAVLNTAATATLSPVTGAATPPDVAAMAGASNPGGWYAGMLVRWTARGFITTTTTTTTATFLLAARVGNTGTTWVTLATTGGLATSATAMTGLPWKLEGLTRCLAAANSGNTLATQFEMYFSPNPATGQTLNTASAGVNLYAPSASGETSAAVDTTQLQGLSLRATLAGANATIQCTQWVVEGLN